VSALDQISWVVTGYAVLVALLAGWSAYRWRRRPPWLVSMAWMLEALVVLRAVAGLGALLTGHKPDQESTHLIYLLASVCILPLALRSVQDDDGVWSLGVVGVAAVVVAAISVRMVMTL
jgi:cell division protein FtsW (lipid II flippase)